ncbi:hypothetical protein SprV_0501832500 [Sparganum proliferum]
MPFEKGDLNQILILMTLMNIQQDPPRPGRERFQESEILSRGDNRVSRVLLESWYSGPRSINGRNDLPLPNSQPRPSLGREISHVGRVRESSDPRDSGPNGRVIIAPTSNTDDEIATINNPDTD